MTIPSPEHLLDQADRLIALSPSGAPRQVDLRRAVPSAYYAVFHAVLIAAADEFIGRARRHETAYGLAYRRVDHAMLRDLCNEMQKSTLSPRYKRHEPTNGFGANLKAFAMSLVELQQRRHAADYDPMIRLKKIGRITCGQHRPQGAPAFYRRICAAPADLPGASSLPSAMRIGFAHANRREAVEC